MLQINKRLSWEFVLHKLMNFISFIYTSLTTLSSSLFAVVNEDVYLLSLMTHLYYLNSQCELDSLPACGPVKGQLPTCFYRYVS